MHREEIDRMVGTVTRTIFENADTGYSVFELECDGDSIVVTGAVGSVNIGMSVTVYGHRINHPVYGEQFAAQSCEICLPQESQAILSYLSSGVLPYIGPSTARKLVDTFGDDSLNVIANKPEKLCMVRGITPKKAAEISAEFGRTYALRGAIDWMEKRGLSAQQAVTAYRTFGVHMVEMLEKNPYLLCGDPLFIRFKQADDIAAGLQVEQDSDLRVAAGLLYSLRRNAGNGHTCVPQDKLLKSVADFLRVGLQRVRDVLDSMIAASELEQRIFDKIPFIYLPDLLIAEEDIAARLREMASFSTKAPKTLERDIAVLERTQGFDYADLQRQAIRLALSSHIMVLTGGPGTGKTTALNAILTLYLQKFDRVALCAPTGRAAKRLSEVTGHSAFTIHRLLEVDYSTGKVLFIHNEKNRLPFDVIILDEMSMVDVKLFQALLAACRPHCRFVLVGDADQLPSVGPGNLLSEILRADILPTVRLTHIFRQAEKSLIVRNAHRIVEGQMPQTGRRDEDFFFLSASGLACQRLVCELVSDRLPKSYGFDPVRDIQVLCPTKLGPAGSVELNRQLQDLLNPPSISKPQLEWDQGTTPKILRLGDKVMQIKNDYDIPFERIGAETGVGAYNGDLGIITAVDRDARVVTVQMDDRLYRYNSEQLVELEPAYAVTVHKSQGSEFSAVVIPVAEVPQRLCYRNLLYTGVTRARKLCILVGTENTVKTMVENVRQNLRYSGLRYLLTQPVEGRGAK